MKTKKCIGVTIWIISICVCTIVGVMFVILSQSQTFNPPNTRFIVGFTLLMITTFLFTMFIVWLSIQTGCKQIEHANMYMTLLAFILVCAITGGVLIGSSQAYYDILFNIGTLLLMVMFILCVLFAVVCLFGARTYGIGT